MYVGFRLACWLLNHMALAPPSSAPIIAMSCPWPAPINRESDEVGLVTRTYLIRGVPPFGRSSFSHEANVPITARAVMNITVSLLNVVIDLQIFCGIN